MGISISEGVRAVSSASIAISESTLEASRMDIKVFKWSRCFMFLVEW